MSMSINVRFSGDVDRLPHKDLAEKIIHAANEAVQAAMEKAGIGDQFAPEHGWQVHNTQVQTRLFMSDEPYSDRGDGGCIVTACWGVHLPDPK